MKVYCIECVHSCSSVGGDKYDQFCKVLRTLHSFVAASADSVQKICL